MELVATAQTEIVIDSTAGDTSLSTIATPDYTGELILAYLVLSVQQVKNWNVANPNGISGFQKIQFRDKALSYHDAISIQAGSFQCMPDSVIGGTFEYVGNINLKQYLEPNYNYLLRWEDAEAYFDSLWLYGTQMKMKLYFGG